MVFITFSLKLDHSHANVLLQLDILSRYTGCEPCYRRNTQAANSHYKSMALGCSLVTQWVKVSLQELGSLLWLGFDPWPQNFYTLQGQPKKKKRKKEKKNPSPLKYSV